MGSPRIPEEQVLFNKYITDLSVYLYVIITGVITRGESLGMTSDEMLKFTTYYKKWANPDLASLGIWILHSNAESKNKYTRTKVLEFMEEFSNWFNPILTRLSVSPTITNADKLILHIGDMHTPHGEIKEPMTEKCNILAEMIGGGMVRLKGKILTDAKRASLPKKANGMEIAHRIDLPNVDTGTDTGSKSKVKNLIANPDDGTTKTIYTKATVIVDYGADNSGNILQLYARYVNIKHRNLDGPWTGPYTFIIG